MAYKKQPVILGMVYGAHDTAAALMIGNEIVAACEEERYNLEKHTRAFPHGAIEDCLKLAGIGWEQVDEIGFCNDPIHYIRENYLKTALAHEDRIGFLIKDIDRIDRAYNMETLVRRETGFGGRIAFHRHHMCHVASAYFPSGFDEALIAIYDGMGEYQTGMICAGRNGKIEEIYGGADYPNSVGLLYSALTYYLGFKHHCDEGIVMGLAPYGNPYALIPGDALGRTYYDLFCEILEPAGEFDYRVNLDYMAYFRVRDTWVEKKFTDILGPKREPGSVITDAHKNIAAALQKRMEDLILGQLKLAREKYGLRRLCLAGGVALNCSMNGRIESSRIFDQIFVQPASGDAGTAVGACYESYRKNFGGLEPKEAHNFYLGHGASDPEILAAAAECGVTLQKPDDIYRYTAEKLAEGKIVGWFQGRAEFGPRALGNRSILTRPYPADMKDYLNARVKFREYFRPFAPAVLAEHCNEYFDIGQPSPHMLIACKVRPEKKNVIPAVVHVDDSCRVQTVTKETNPRFRKLLEAFNEVSGIPVLLNTSFNVKGQPIVNRPEQAIKCFQSTNIDVLVVGDYVVEKKVSN